MGPHRANRSCCYLTEPHSRSMINWPQPNAHRIDRGVFWPIAATRASLNGVPSPWAAATSPSISSGIRRGVSSHLPASQIVGQDRIVDATPGHTGPHRATPGRLRWAPLPRSRPIPLGVGEDGRANDQTPDNYQEDPAPRGYNEPAGERLAQTAPRMRQPGGPSATTLRSPRLKPQPAVNLTHSQEGIEHSTCGGWNFRQRLAFARIVVFVC